MLRRMGQRLNQWRRLEQHTRLFVYTRQLLCACAHMATMLGACTRRSFSPVQLTWGVIQGAPLFLHSGTSGMTSVHSWQFTYWYWNIVWHPVNNHWPPLYVDDIIIIGWKDGLEEVKTAKFNIKDLGELNYFLGIKVDQYTQDSIWIGQPSHLLKTQHASEQHLQAHQSRMCVWTRRSICLRLEVCCISLFVHGQTFHMLWAVWPDSPTKEHWLALKRLLRYLKGTPNYGWRAKVNLRVRIFAMWWSNLMEKQRCVALSTAESEYVAMASAAQESVWLRQLTSTCRLTYSNVWGQSICYRYDKESSIPWTWYQTSLHSRTSDTRYDHSQILSNYRNSCWHFVSVVKLFANSERKLEWWNRNV